MHNPERSTANTDPTQHIVELGQIFTDLRVRADSLIDHPTERNYQSFSSTVSRAKQLIRVFRESQFFNKAGSTYSSVLALLETNYALTKRTAELGNGQRASVSTPAEPEIDTFDEVSPEKLIDQEVDWLVDAIAEDGEYALELEPFGFYRFQSYSPSAQEVTNVLCVEYIDNIDSYASAVYSTVPVAGFLANQARAREQKQKLIDIGSTVALAGAAVAIRLLARSHKPQK
jgi:hypothetical protein